jgi:hypothetical protein
MAKPPVSRGLIMNVWNNFVKSLKTDRFGGKAVVIGDDCVGNRYYEIPADPRLVVSNKTEK